MVPAAGTALTMSCGYGHAHALHALIECCCVQIRRQIQVLLDRERVVACGMDRGFMSSSMILFTSKYSK